MKIKIILPITIFAVSLLIAPQITFANWWNPFTWKNIKKSEVKIEQVIIATSTLDNYIMNTGKTTLSAPENLTGANTKKINISNKQSSIKKVVKTKINDDTKLKKETLSIQEKELEVAEKQKSLETSEQIKEIENRVKQQIANDALTKKTLDPAVMAIDAFLLNPTIDNLKLFCNKAKTISGNEQEKVLNDTRTDFVMKTITTLREQSQIKYLCDLALGERKDNSGGYISSSLFQWVIYNPSYILEFNDNDSDAIRGIKINYNNYWKSLSSYKLIGFKTYSTSGDITTPNVAMEEKINQTVKVEGETSSEKVAQIIATRLRNLERDNTRGYNIPEKILSDFREQIMSR